ncbi:hypothetical protein CPJCM30710_25290 [Clostridium polyendosporum]|uniref:HTH cro/C1-type domain-containing protein n=1 Tax=Clostridium polyendosporum TaxID=69208 RepID=A0A919S249_9CLOT|nr:helix-turn-helix transcriptional regulator [Clostridium polyendosporum]GIM29863.1 hypothetical protein CPJCM30710_25290 [Clostridium polyendosporum]
MLRIKETRKTVGITQQELAQKVGATREYISNIENNHKKPSLDLLERIALVLNTSIKDLIEDSA